MSTLKLKEVPPFSEEVDDSPGSSETPSTPLGRKKHSVNRSWSKTQEFESHLEAEDHLNGLKIWSKTTTTTTVEGEKIYFRCNKGSFRDSECKSAVYLLYHSDSQMVSLYSTNSEHDNHTDGKRGLPEADKKLIGQLFADGIEKPNAIIAAFHQRKLPEPPKSKLKCLLQTFRIQKYGPPKISATEFREWCMTNSEIPKDDDTPFVLKHSIHDEISAAGQDLKVVLSTKRLLNNGVKSNLIQVDATYKLIWQGYPVLIFGTSDMNRVFHPFGLAICHGENGEDFGFIFAALKSYLDDQTENGWKYTHLLADGSDAITNEFISVFGKPERRLMCYFHVMQKVDCRLRGITCKEAIRADITLLQVSASDRIFDKAADLFLLKWTAKKDPKINEFIEYFQDQWLKTQRFWYEGASLEFPTTNNGLEAMNGVIKKEHTFRERLPLGQFLTVVTKKILKKWSKERNPESANYKNFAQLASFTLHQWTKGYQWASLNVQALEEEFEEKSVFYSPSSINTNRLTHADVEDFKAQRTDWTAFDEFRANAFLVWKIEVYSRNCKPRSDCSSPVFAKEKVCKHSLGMLIRLGLVKVPPEAKSVPLGQKRKRGRPERAKPALLVQ